MPRRAHRRQMTLTAQLQSLQQTLAYLTMTMAAILTLAAMTRSTMGMTSRMGRGHLSIDVTEGFERMKKHLQEEEYSLELEVGTKPAIEMRRIRVNGPQCMVPALHLLALPLSGQRWTV